MQFNAEIAREQTIIADVVTMPMEAMGAQACT